MNDMNEEMTPVEEQALDALLHEAHGKSVPPDFSYEILSRLRQLPDQQRVASPIVCDDMVTRRTSPRSGATTQQQFAIALSVIAAVAALLLIGFVIRRNGLRPVETPSIEIAESGDSAAGIDSLAQQSLPTVGASSTNHDSLAPDSPAADVTPEPKPARSRPRGIPLVIETPGTGSSAAESPLEINTQSPSSSEAITLVSAAVQADLESYWQAVGITPSEQASPEDIAERLALSLGVELSPQSIGDPQAIENELARENVARAIARQWLREITQGGLGRLEKESQDRLIQEVAESFQSRKSLDRVLASWIGGQSDNMSSFYTAVASGGEHQMVRRLAALTMNVDLRCVQCHDALIESSGRQKDYWSFAAFLRQGLKRQQNKWTLEDNDEPSEPLFYSLLDGRQRVAEPAIASRWLSTQEPVTAIGQWSNELVGSSELARGIVNSLWKLVYGQPLKGQVIDTITAPHNESLNQLQQRLTDDLVNSRFDVGRTLALILSSPATRRSVPEALRPENALVSSGLEIQSAMQSVNAFAAALPPRNHLSLDRRIDVAMHRIGARIDRKGEDSVLAQPGSSELPATIDINGSQAPAARRPESGNDFPGKATTPPVQWLAAIEDEKNRIEHLGYLAGMSEVPEKLIEAAQAIGAAEENDDLLLHRVWWLVRP